MIKEYVKKREGLLKALLAQKHTTKMVKSFHRQSFQGLLKLIQEKFQKEHEKVGKTCEIHPKGQRNCEECFHCKFTRRIISNVLKQLK